MNRNSNIKHKGKPSGRGNRREHNKAGTCCAPNCKNHKKKCIKNEVNSANNQAPLNHGNETLPRTSNSQKMEGSVETATDNYNEKYLFKEKDSCTIDLRSEIIRITDDIKIMYSKFTSQMLHLQFKYFQDITLQNDIEDILFIHDYNKLIYKLKTELTKKQQDLTSSYNTWNNYKWDHLNLTPEMRRKLLSGSSTDSEIGPTAFDTEDYNQRTRSSKKRDLKNNNRVIPKNTMYPEGSSSETTDEFLSSSDEECKHVSQRNACIRLDNLPEIKWITLPSNSSTHICKTKKDCVSNSETPFRYWVSTSDEQAQNIYVCPKVKQEIPDYISDYKSSFSEDSTIEICSVVDEDELEELVVEPSGDDLVSSANTSMIRSVNDVNYEVLRSSDSVDYKIDSTTQNLQAPCEYHSTPATEPNACPSDDVSIVFEQLSIDDFPDGDSLNIKGSINKLIAVDLKYSDTDQNCSDNVEYSIPATQDLQDPCNYSSTSTTKPNAYPPDDTE